MVPIGALVEHGVRVESLPEEMGSGPRIVHFGSIGGSHDQANIVDHDLTLSNVVVPVLGFETCRFVEIPPGLGDLTDTERHELVPKLTLHGEILVWYVEELTAKGMELELDWLPPEFKRGGIHKDLLEMSDSSRQNWFVDARAAVTECVS